jgi:hypothetical protein
MGFNEPTPNYSLVWNIIGEMSSKGETSFWAKASPIYLRMKQKSHDFDLGLRILVATKYQATDRIINILSLPSG